MPGKYLVIVESPTKIKSISRYLGNEYEVLSSKGHIIDLPKSNLGIDVEHNFKPDYTPVKGKSAVISDLKTTSKKAKIIFLATDLDREGEAIAWHVASALGGLDDAGKINDKNRFKRVVFAEITETAIQEAFKKPRGFDYNLVDAYQARRVLDRLVGYKLSPLLWKKIMYGLSAGRVQSIAVRLIVEREKEKNAFEKSPYFRIYAEAKHHSSPFEAELTLINDEKIEQQHTLNLFASAYNYKSTIIDKTRCDKILGELNNCKQLRVTGLTEKSASKKPYPPLATASMQRAAQTSLGFSAKQTMVLAQKLYEEGFITYHRTDSTNLSTQFIDAARKFIQSEYGNTYLPEKPIHYATTKKGAQEAHEAIRPTKVEKLDKTLGQIQIKLSTSEAKLFSLIWRRAIASQASDAQFNYSSIVLTPNLKIENQYIFTAKGSYIVFDGFRKIYGSQFEDKELPQVSKNDLIELNQIKPSEHETTPPPRYTEASLIKDLEINGIGRPSTYAPTIDTILARDYVFKDGSALIPEDTGIVVNKLLVDHFPEIVNLEFTASLENNLDRVATGEMEWSSVIRDFYQPFDKEVTKAETNLTRDDYKILERLTEKCPDCSHHIVLKLGKYGKFYSCSNFPECKYARPFLERIGLKCFGCKDGDIIVRRSRFGRKFFGCSSYPNCEWASWNDPRDPNFEEKEAKSKARSAAIKKARAGKKPKTTKKKRTKKTPKKK